MQRITKRLLSIALFFIAILLLVSCATGRKFQMADKIPEGMGLVYLYWPGHRIIGPGEMSPHIDANGVGIVRLFKGGYYHYFSKPGEVEFSSKSSIIEPSSVETIYIEAGQTYYIKGTVASHALVKYLRLTAVPPEIGEKEIADCRLLEGRQPALEGKMSKTDTSAFTPEEILLLKRSGVSDEKILEMQKKGERLPASKINAFDWNEDGKKDIITGSDSGKVYVYLNKGTNQQPEFDMANEISTMLK
jgi:hypothetical protein